VIPSTEGAALRPIHYRSVVAIRFSDLDLYGHVNSSHYLDYVISSRWEFARVHSNVTVRELAAKKVGFYLSQAQTTFRRPIGGVGSIVAVSHVERIVEARLVVPYAIRSEDETVLHADGTLEFVTIDLTTNKPIPVPDWAFSLFFEK
jgi:acyl-CoA thioester hydrolase